MIKLGGWVWCKNHGCVHPSMSHGDIDDQCRRDEWVYLYTAKEVADSVVCPKGLKVYAGSFCGRFSWIVMARSQAAAARAFDITVYELKQYGSTTGNTRQIEAAVEAGEGVMLHSKNDFHSEYVVGHPYGKNP